MNAPRSDSEFDAWLGNLWTSTVGRPDLAAADVEELTDAWTSWRTAYTLRVCDLTDVRSRAEAAVARVLRRCGRPVDAGDPLA